MMELLPPVGWADVARQRDVDRLETTMDRQFDELDRRIDVRFDSLGARFDEIDRRFDSLDQRFATKDDLREQTNRFIGWTVASNATLVATIALIMSLR